MFDTHRSHGRFVATIELLTEVVQPFRVGRDRIRRFERDARRLGLLPIPYSNCVFKGNLHVYSFSGPVRGFDLATPGPSTEDSERTLQRRLETLWSQTPGGLRQAQRDLLHGRRRARYHADLEVMRNSMKALEAGRHGDPPLRRTAREPSRL
jgi:hypothetical protein